MKLIPLRYRKRCKSPVSSSYYRSIIDNDVYLFKFFFNLTGRAGRFGTQWEHGYVTTFNQADLSTLQMLLSQKPEPLEKAGLHPTAEQIELYAYYLPKATLSNLIVRPYFSRGHRSIIIYCHWWWFFSFVAGHFRIFMHRGWSIFHVRSGRFQIFGWDDPTCAVAAARSIRVLLFTNQSKNAIRLLHVFEGKFHPLPPLDWNRVFLAIMIPYFENYSLPANTAKICQSLSIG